MALSVHIENAINEIKSAQNQVFSIFQDHSQHSNISDIMWEGLYNAYRKLADGLTFLFPTANAAYKINSNRFPHVGTEIFNPYIIQRELKYNSVSDFRDGIKSEMDFLLDQLQTYLDNNQQPPDTLRHDILQHFWVCFFTALLSSVPFNVVPPVLDTTGTTFLYTSVTVSYDPATSYNLSINIKNNLNTILPPLPSGDRSPIILDIDTMQSFPYYGLFVNPDFNQGFDYMIRLILYNFLHDIVLSSFPMVINMISTNVQTGVSTPLTIPTRLFFSDF